jgi:4-carboxymuconolactone decarboxylase/3-oxoadipate enol-lactonase/4-carboxymuconolactone decarboxylase
MDDQHRREQGTAMRRRVLGDAHVDRATARTTPATADFQDLLTRYAWGEIWSRPHFDVRTRRLLVVATLIALGRWEELRIHVRAALEARDLTAADVAEVALQQAIYCGLPAANAAFEIIRDATTALDAEHGERESG